MPVIIHGFDKRLVGKHLDEILIRRISEAGIILPWKMRMPNIQDVLTAKWNWLNSQRVGATEK